nr:MAG TPA: coiled-coil domain-containing protein [Caudoviricetes sp.]
MDEKQYKELMEAIRNVEYEVMEVRHSSIRALSASLLIFILGFLIYFGIILYQYLEK